MKTTIYGLGFKVRCLRGGKANGNVCILGDNLGLCNHKYLFHGYCLHDATVGWYVILDLVYCSCPLLPLTIGPSEK